MKETPPSSGNADRRAALERHDTLRTPPDAVLDGITQAAADLCETPIALISLVDPARRWVKARTGTSVREASRDLALRAHAILEPTALTEVVDTSRDERFRDDPLVSGEPGIRFYAGRPLLTSDDSTLGTLCVIDHEPRRLSAAQRDGLDHLAQVVTDLLEERREATATSTAIDRAVEQAARHGVLITDPRQPDNPITYANRAFEVMTGYSRAELMGKNCRLLQGPDTDPETVTRLREAIAAREPCTVLLKNYRKDGVAFWNELAVSPIEDRKGNVVNYVGIQNDVSDRETARQRLAQLSDATDERILMRASRDRLAQIVEDSVNEIYVADAETFGILSTNRAARENLGYTEDESRQLMPWDFIEGLTRERMSALVEPLRSGALDAHEYEIVHRRKDGSTYPVAAHLQFMATQTPPVYTAIVQDITERQRQRAMIELRDRAIESLDVGVSITDAAQDDYPLVYVNQALCTLTGYTSDELLGRGVRMLQRHDRHQAAHREIRAAQARGEPVQVILESTRKDGSRYASELSLSPVHDRAGRLAHYIGISRDVTAKLDAEARSRQVQKLEALGQLAGGVAHDFNNLLAVIAGNIEMLAADIADGAHRELLDEADRATRMGARLTRRLLTFARRRRLQPVVLDANDHVRDAMELLRSTIGETIALSSSLSPALWKIRADPSEIENAIVNLAINARDSMPDGGRMDVVTKNVSVVERGTDGDSGIPPGDYARLSITDTGCGMSDAVRARMFEPFFTTKGPDNGTGLGLASVHGFVAQSGGHVHVRSEVGQGTTITLYLPRYAGDPATSTPEASTSPARTTPGGNGVRVLVVEDNDMVRRTTVRALRAMGFETAHVSGGPEAVRRLENGPDVDLVLSDVVMGDGMSGYDVARWVLDNRPECKILLTSGFTERMADDGDMDMAELPLLSKPYSLEELQRMLLGVLHDRPTVRE